MDTIYKCKIDRRTRDLSIDRSILHACWLRFTAESIVADWLASEFCLLSTDEIDMRRLDASAAVACQIDLCQLILLAGWLI